MELRQYINVLIKWWWLIVASVVVASVSSFLGTLATPRTYQSHTTLMVGQVLQNPNPNPADIATGQALAQSYADLATREPVLKGTLKELRLDWNWMTLQSMVSSRVVPGTQLLEISVLDTDPQRAQVLAQTIAEQLILQSPAGTDPTQAAEHDFITTQIQDLKANIEKGQDDIRQLNDVIASATSARQIEDARTRQAALGTQVSTWQATYAQLLTTLQQGTTNVLSVVEPAQIPASPVSSGATQTVAIAATIGLVLASGAAFLLEYLDDTIKTSGDVLLMLELPVLGPIGQINGGGLVSKLVTVTRPRAPIAEAYRVLRTNLQFSAIDRSLRTLMITSASPLEGKSVTAANLAVVLAQAGNRVTLVDADLRRPMQHTIFGLDNEAGLTSMLRDGNMHPAQVQPIAELPNLKVLTCGPIPPNPSEMLGSKRMIELIEKLQEQSDIVIFDSAPVMAVSDAAVLAARVDGVLLVVNSGYTRRTLAQRSKQALAAVNAHVLGVVINRLPGKGESFYYSTYFAQEGATRPRSAREVLSRLSVAMSRVRLFGRNGHSARTTDVASINGEETGNPRVSKA